MQYRWYNKPSHFPYTVTKVIFEVTSYVYLRSHSHWEKQKLLLLRKLLLFVILEVCAFINKRYAVLL